MNLALVHRTAQEIIHNVERVIVGKRRAVEQAVITLLCQGHLLIEDIPGVGKTMLARSLARSLGADFRRIQFTPDMLPSDITGVTIYNQASGQFEFRPGPIMAHIVLADEINRATPKTQAALLEAMEEGQVTVDGVTHPLPRPFMVMATQNPIEYEGTFPLPEAQLDRFFMRIRLGYPTPREEERILESQRLRHPIANLQPVVDLETLRRAQQAVREVHVAPEVRRYIVELTRRTRDLPGVYLGASPRGSLALFRAAQAQAALEERDYVIPEDVQRLAVPVLAHRLILAPQARLQGRTPEDVVRELLEQVPAPGTTPFPAE